MNPYESFFYWFIKILSPLLIVLGGISIIMEVPEPIWGYLMAPLGVIGLFVAWALRANIERGGE